MYILSPRTGSFIAQYGLTLVRILVQIKANDLRIHVTQKRVGCAVYG
uniref:Uncharacterized protein n=1 Tax=Anguilla anguilla TaxID=7936 RepID=A0A0E9QZN8_ANGAN